MSVLLPDDRETCSVLYLLHGQADTHRAWMDRSEIERLSEEYQIAVVMPDARDSYYNNVAEGDYYDHVALEVPQVAHDAFGLSNDPKKTHIAGLSMGGYGAFFIAMRNPTRFCTAASFSGVVDLYARFCEGDCPVFRAVFPDYEVLRGSTSDLMTVMETLTGSPQLYQFCGTEDHLYYHNQNFLNKAKQCGLPIEYFEAPGGHDWKLWREQIKEYIPWMLAKEKTI